MLLAALADGRAVDYMSFIGLRFIARRCNRPHIAGWEVRLRRSPEKRHLNLLSARPRHRRHYEQIFSSGPELLSAAGRNHADSGLYPEPATPARLRADLPAEI